MRWRVARKVFKVWSYRHRKSTVLRAVLKVTHPGPHRRTLWPLVQTAERLRTKGTDRPLTSPPPRRPRARAPDHGRYYRQAAFSRARVGQRHNAYKSARLDVTPPRLGRFRAGLGDCGRLRHLLPDVSEVCIRAARASPAPPRSLSLTAPGGNPTYPHLPYMSPMLHRVETWPSTQTWAPRNVYLIIDPAFPRGVASPGRSPRWPNAARGGRRNAGLSRASLIESRSYVRETTAEPVA